MTETTDDFPLSAAAVGDARRDVVLAEGPEAIAYLHGQLSQDVLDIEVGGTRWSFLLQPQGKVLGHLRVTRIADEAVVLDCDAGTGDAVFASLDRFKLRTKVTFSNPHWPVLGLRGPSPPAIDPDGATIVAVPTLWPGPRAVDLILTDSSLAGRPLAELVAAVPALAALPLVDAAAWEAARIESGVPRLGVDIDERTIPHETGLVPRSVSFTKGCYRGQELVERIESRGAVRRRLCLMTATVPLEVGEVLHDDERDVGVVTSVTTRIRVGSVALGYVRRETCEGAAVFASSGDIVTVGASIGET